MPSEIGTNSSSNDRHKESLNELKSLLSSIAKFDTNPPSNQEMYSLLVKRFLFTLASVKDEFFLSDVCGLSYELFVELRINLGYFEAGKLKKIKMAMRDTIELCNEIYRKFQDYLYDPGYNGTNFPKPSKLKAMRELAGIVASKEDIVVLRKGDLRRKKQPKTKDFKSKKDNYFEIDMIFNKNEISFDNDELNIDSSDNESSISTFEMPTTPQLNSEEISSMKSATILGSKGSILLAAVGDLMPPPPPPSSDHGRVKYVKVEKPSNKPPPPPPPSLISRRSSNPLISSQLRPPILVDDDGDILPNTAVPTFPFQPQLKSATASIYESSDGRIIVDDYISYPTSNGYTPKDKSWVLEDDDSFIQAYREYAMESGNVMEEDNVTFNRKKSVDKSELDLSGWSMKNRITR